MLPARLQMALDAAFQQSHTDFNKWLFIVHAQPARLIEQAQAIQAAFGWPLLELGKTIAPQIAPLTARIRTSKTQQLLTAALVPPRIPMICCDIDILFAPELALDPLALFDRASRRTSLVIMWPGSFVDGVLRYAVPEHEHSRIWQATISPERIFVL